MLDADSLLSAALELGQRLDLEGEGPLELRWQGPVCVERFEDSARFVPAEGKLILKIGLSISPKLRLAAFQKMMPQGAFVWEMCRSTRIDGYAPYPSFEAAEVGERAMKELLGTNGRWLGGEFYAATTNAFGLAWEAGRRAASSYPKN
jgi:hypothetical protein